MRWPKTPTDILSEKTFLVIRDNLQTIQEKSQEREADIIESPKKTNSSCDTWPPKMRKKRPRKSNSNNNGNSENSDIEEPRPATASLEAPLVLDPRLVDKLDMSLLSKESLTASLTRINLGLVKSLDNNTTTKSLDSTTTKSLDITTSKASIESSIKSNNYQKPAPTTRTRIPSPPTRVSARREQLAHSLESSSVLLETDITRTSNEVTSNPEVKRLDDNNNKNKNGSTCQHHLSPLRSRSSRGINLADVSLISGASAASARKKILPNNTNVTPEACKSCGRSCLPERLHSHPKSPTYFSKELVNSARSSPSVIPIRTTGNRSLRKSAKIESTQSPDTNLPSNMASPKSEKSVGSFAKSPSSECAPAKKDRKLTSTAIPKSKDDKPVTAVQEKKRRPRSVTCYICGREFGTASFPIHEPKCLEKWQRENDALPAAQRRKLPIRPEVPFDHEDWNTAAWEQSQALLVPCIKCKRTFLPDRLPVHERNCRVPNKESQKK